MKFTIRYPLMAVVGFALIGTCSDAVTACDQVCDPWPGTGGQCISIGTPIGSTCHQVEDLCYYTVNDCRAATPKVVASLGTNPLSPQSELPWAVTEETGGSCAKPVESLAARAALDRRSE